MTIKLTHAQVAQHLDVLVNVACFGPIGGGRFCRNRCGIQRSLLGQGTGVVNLLHARATVTGLYRFNGRTFAA